MSKLVPLKRLIILRAGGVLLVALLIGLVSYLSLIIRELRRDIIVEGLVLEEGLSGAVHYSSLKTVLGERGHDIERIMRVIPRRDTIGDVVGRLEEEGRQLDVIVRVPEVAEEVLLDKSGESVGESGPLQDIRLGVIATGKPDDLMRFWHKVEHLPFLNGVVSAKFEGETVRQPVSLSSLVPISGPPGAQGENVSETRGNLRLDVIVSSFREVKVAN